MNLEFTCKIVLGARHGKMPGPVSHGLGAVHTQPTVILLSKFDAIFWKNTLLRFAVLVLDYAYNGE